MGMPDRSNNNYLRDAFVAGDDNAYSKIYEMYAKGLYAFGLSMRANREIIEDAMHDIFAEIFSHRRNLADVQNLKLYFMIAFRNRLFFLMKREVVYVDMNDRYSQIFAEKNHMETWIERERITENNIRVNHLMSELSPHQREVIYLRFIEGLTLDQIALIMNINYQSVKNLIHRSIKRLSKL